jgi:hypothetical protein
MFPRNVGYFQRSTRRYSPEDRTLNSYYSVAVRNMQLKDEYPSSGPCQTDNFKPGPGHSFQRLTTCGSKTRVPYRILFRSGCRKNLFTNQAIVLRALVRPWAPPDLFLRGGRQYPQTGGGGGVRKVKNRKFLSNIYIYMYRGV